uniref:Secreted protein n=1 Tax=Rhabditophanes sp. KR3021 TaxID=114890 RepID=A0AC35TKB0_9BILA
MKFGLNKRSFVAIYLFLNAIIIKIIVPDPRDIELGEATIALVAGEVFNINYILLSQNVENLFILATAPQPTVYGGYEYSMNATVGTPS